MKRKQLEFIKAYTTPNQSGYCNASESAKIAGYSVKSRASLGINLLKDPKIAKEVSIRQQERDAKLSKLADITKDEYLCLAREALETVGHKHANFTKLMEIVGKVKGFFVETANTQIMIYNESQDNDSPKKINSRINNLLNRAKKVNSIPEIPSPSESSIPQ